MREKLKKLDLDRSNTKLLQLRKETKIVKREISRVRREAAKKVIQESRAVADKKSAKIAKNTLLRLIIRTDTLDVKIRMIKAKATAIDVALNC